MSATTGATKSQIKAAERRAKQDKELWGSPRFFAGYVIDRSAEFLVPSTHRLIPRAYLDALEALLDAGSSIGVSNGRYAAEHVWQNAENERDAAREEMGLL